MSVTYGSEHEAPEIALPKRDTGKAVLRGLFCKCPSCGAGRIFNGYLTVARECNSCREELHHHRADDAPPYFTIFLVGHLIVPLALGIEIAYRPDMWIHMALWLPLTILSSLFFLRPIKGALIGLQWGLYMHGFDPNNVDPDAPEESNIALAEHS